MRKKSRQEVHDYLVELSGYGNNVYFNPPETVKMNYPCIVYNVADLGAKHADNFPYYRFDIYTVTHIYSKITQSVLSNKLASTTGFNFDRHYYADNLYHDVFTFRTL